MTVTDPAHVAVAQQLREDFTRPTRVTPTQRWCVTWPTTTGRSASIGMEVA